MFKDLPRSKLLKQIARLNLIAGTPKTAFKLGPQVKKVELFLLHKNIFVPGAGLKKFWRQNMPVLKFHNDDVDFVTTRLIAENKEEVAKAPTKIIVHNKDGSSTEFDCALKTNSQILNELVKVTEGVKVSEENIPVIARPKPKQ